MAVIFDEVVGEVVPSEAEQEREGEEGGDDSQMKEQGMDTFRRQLARLEQREARLRAD